MTSPFADRPTGGPVFPITFSRTDSDGFSQSGATHTGMTLRDLFAAAALQGLLAHGEYHPATVWKIADQMVAARVGSPPASPPEGGGV